MAFLIFQKFLLLAPGRLLSASVDSHLLPAHNNPHAKVAYFGVDILVSEGTPYPLLLPPFILNRHFPQSISCMSDPVLVSASTRA